uniref:Uncharacterized protein n=1 Tax=Rhizophora mucronata TaxID=61149 RepID=A0A2P2LV71_RHIMU
MNQLDYCLFVVWSILVCYANLHRGRCSSVCNVAYDTRGRRVAEILFRSWFSMRIYVVGILI